MSSLAALNPGVVHTRGDPLRLRWSATRTHATSHCCIARPRAANGHPLHPHGPATRTQATSHCWTAHRQGLPLAPVWVHAHAAFDVPWPDRAPPGPTHCAFVAQDICSTQLFACSHPHALACTRAFGRLHASASRKHAAAKLQTTEKGWGERPPPQPIAKPPFEGGLGGRTPHPTRE